MPLKINRLESTTRKLRDGPDAPTKKAEGREKTDKPGRVIISVDVHELGPIEMEVGSLTRGIALQQLIRLFSRAESL